MTFILSWETSSCNQSNWLWNVLIASYLLCNHPSYVAITCVIPQRENRLPWGGGKMTPNRIWGIWKSKSSEREKHSSPLSLLISTPKADAHHIWLSPSEKPCELLGQNRGIWNGLWCRKFPAVIPLLRRKNANRQLGNWADSFWESGL